MKQFTIIEVCRIEPEQWKEALISLFDGDYNKKISVKDIADAVESKKISFEDAYGGLERLLSNKELYALCKPFHNYALNLLINALSHVDATDDLHVAYNKRNQGSIHSAIFALTFIEQCRLYADKDPKALSYKVLQQKRYSMEPTKYNEYAKAAYIMTVECKGSLFFWQARTLWNNDHFGKAFPKMLDYTALAS